MAFNVPISISNLNNTAGNFARMIDDMFGDIPGVSNPYAAPKTVKSVAKVGSAPKVLGTKAPSAQQTNLAEVTGDSGIAASSTYSAEEAAAAEAEAKRQAEVAGLRGEISGRGGEYEALINELFGQLDALLRERGEGVEKEYGEQFKKAADTYTAAVPQIANSYAAIGAGDSTDKSDAKDGAKRGFDDTNSTIKKNKEADLTKIGQYGNEQKAKFGADRDAAKRNVARAGETDDVDALRGMRNDLETNLGNARVTKATLGTDSGARGELSKLTQDGGRFEAAQNALDGIIKSSMSGAVKEAAVKSIVDNAGLSDEEKQKVQLQYGNVYQEQNLA